MRINLPAICLTLVLIAPMAHGAEAPELSSAEFRRQHESLFDEAAKQAWRKIGWRVSVAEAIDRAKKEDKALLLWVSYGPPLTCG